MTQKMRPLPSQEERKIIPQFLFVETVRIVLKNPVLHFDMLCLYLLVPTVDPPGS